MRINNNIPSMVTQGALNGVNRDMSKSLERLSTGLRINRASDDAAGLGVSENLRTQIRGTAQARRNAMDGIAAITIAEGAANEISDILQRMRELAVQSSNDTLTDTERGYTDAEFQSLMSEIDRIAGVTNYNGMKLISDDTGAARFGEVDAGSNLWIDANAAAGVDSIEVEIADLTTAGLTLTGVDVSDQANSVAAITSLDDAINTVNEMRSDMGAYVNRLEHAINNLTISNTNQQSAESLIRDVDFASESAQFTRNQILTQSGTSMLAQANMAPQSVLSLL
ncbi:flagellin [Chitinispirillales bacterium ANBcel5]|uniref:flagellin N-terminal helical domain-containing protein n=1 Tax=Cellulosispirillum alkaliphilum TaxID=3039283 RepID=UPI002A503692|nr:flagellin [Chitinispirillales bacterium ANBcel5]